MKPATSITKETEEDEIISFRQVLFWDVDPKTIDPEKHARYIIERVLDFGNDIEARWVYRTYPKKFIHDVITKSRVLHPETKALWGALVTA